MAEAGELFLRLVRAPFRRPGVITEITASCDRSESGFPDEIEAGFPTVTPNFLAIHWSRPEHNCIRRQELEKGRSRSFLLARLKKFSLRLDHRADRLGRSFRAQSCGRDEQKYQHPSHWKAIVSGRANIAKKQRLFFCSSSNRTRSWICPKRERGWNRQGGRRFHCREIAR